MYHLGVDLGGTNIAVCIANDNGEIIARANAKTLNQRSYDEIMGDFLAVCDEVIRRAKITVADVSTIGVGIPGTIDTKNLRVIYTNNIPALSATDMGKTIREHFPDMKINFGNDADVAAYGEVMCGAAKGAKNVVMITLGTGVGSGIIINGKIYNGFNGGGGEIGHSVIFPDGEMCTCGRCGCWEQYASVTALVRQTKEALDKYPDSLMHKIVAENDGKINGLTSFNAMRKGDKAGKEVVDKYVEYICIGVANVISIFQPEYLLIGGGISKEGDALMIPIAEYVKKNTYGYEAPTEKTKIIKAELSNDAGLIGAAMLFRQDEN